MNNIIKLLVCFTFLCNISSLFGQINCDDPEPDGYFLRGDANNDGVISVSDYSYIQMYLWQGGDPSCEEDAADFDDNGVIELTDQVAVNQYLFQGGPPPAAPFPDFGYDETEDYLFNQLSPRPNPPDNKKPDTWVRLPGETGGGSLPYECGNAYRTASPGNFHVFITNGPFPGQGWNWRNITSFNNNCDNTSRKDRWTIEYCVITGNNAAQITKRALDAKKNDKTREVVRTKLSFNGPLVFMDRNCCIGNINGAINKTGIRLGDATNPCKVTVVLKERGGNKRYNLTKVITTQVLCEMQVNQSGSGCLVDGQDQDSFQKVCPSVVKDVCFTGSEVDSQSFSQSGATVDTAMQVEKVKIENIIFYSDITVKDLSRNERCDLGLVCEIAYKWATAAADPCTTGF